MAGPVKADHVLLIEDDRWVQSVLAELLQDEGYIVSRARTSRDGMRLAQRVEPGLIVLDLHLPDTPGVQLLEELKKGVNTRNIPVLVVSAHPEQLDACVECADGVHLKPFDVSALLEHVQQLMRNRKCTTTGDENGCAPMRNSKKEGVNCTHRLFAGEDEQASAASTTGPG